MVEHRDRSIPTLREELSFSIGSQGETLSGTLISPEEGNSNNEAILFIHGWQSNRSGYIPRAEALTQLGFQCMVFDLRGHGDSFGENGDYSRQDHLNDVVAAFDELALITGLGEDQISTVGASYGGYLASILTTLRPVRHLVLRAPSMYSDDDFTKPTASLDRDKLITLRQSALKPSDSVALKAISKYQGSGLLIACENDTAVPRQTIENYRFALRNNASFEYTVLPNADHNLSTPEYKQRFIDVLTTQFTRWHNKS